jgi:hypothetical protein
MPVPAPPIDQRSVNEIVAQTKGLLKHYTHIAGLDWPLTDDGSRGPERALIHIFAHLAELVITRLNKAPEKNFLAFLDLLGAALLPPQPAQAPLMFVLAARSDVDSVVVPAGTQVAALPAAGEEEPVIFETERELVLTSAQLTSLFTRHPEQYTYADRSAILTALSLEGVPVFQGDSAIEHIFYLGHKTVLGYPSIENLSLAFVLGQDIQDADLRELQWEHWDGARWKSITPTPDNTNSLTRSGTIDLGSLPNIPARPVHSIENRWLRCRLITPITAATAKQAGKVRASQLPDIASVTLQVSLKSPELSVEKAFSNAIPVDLSKDFFPFGDNPKLGDTLYLAHAQAFSIDGATVTVQIEMSPLNANASSNPKLRWEFLAGNEWVPLGTSTPTGPEAPIANDFQDTTKAFTATGTGQVSFILNKPAVAAYNGIESFWIRVRIVSGDYGEEAHYVKDNNEIKLEPSTLKPPSISSIKVSYQTKVDKLLQTPPDTVLLYNNLSFEDVTGKPFTPFSPIKDTQPSLYFGFTLAPERQVFPNRTLSLYFSLAERLYGDKPDNPNPVSSPRLVWDYWNGQWTRLTVRDETEALTRSGLVALLAPADVAPSTEFGLERYWLRLRWESGDYIFAPWLRGVFLNTTLAAHTSTIRHEVLGSSDDSKNQTFRTTRVPVLAGQQLEVWEPDMPSAEEQRKILSEEDKDAISASDTPERTREIWVRWHEVTDFYGSDPRDRHYVLDHLTGELRFGDGMNGLIPPRGTNNMRMARYQTGGGTAGNKPVGTIGQLLSTVPGIDTVANVEAASGGAEAETLGALLERAPQTVRHGGRAVTLEDYADLAALATPEVARARCVPLRDLVAEPFGHDEETLQPGKVSVIIVPRSTDVQPIPSLELLRRVQEYLAAHGPPTVDLSVVGPLYVRVDVTAEIALAALQGASLVEQTIYAELARFLHPLIGGLDGTGWSFGRAPHRSDVYALIEAVAGVDYVRTLKITEAVDEREDLDTIKKTGRYLVYSGHHDITLVF